MTTADAAEFLAELISQLFHADVLITEQSERIEAPEAEIERLRTAPPEGKGRPHERPPLSSISDGREIRGGVNTDGLA